jgi:hypothetical protein
MLKYVQIQIAITGGDEYFSPLRPKSSGDLLDTSCTLCNCKKFED